MTPRTFFLALRCCFPLLVMLLLATMFHTSLLHIAAQTTPDVRDAGGWSTSAPQPLLSFSNPQSLLQDRLVDSLWYLNAQINGFVEFDTRSGNATYVIAPGVMDQTVVRGFDQDGATGTVYVITNAITVYSGTRNPTTKELTMAPYITTPPTYQLFSIAAESNIVFLVYGTSGSATVGLLMYNATDSHAPVLLRTVLVSDRPCGVTGTGVYPLPIWMSRETNELIWSCGAIDSGIAVFDLGNITSAPPRLALTGVQESNVCTTGRVWRDPLSKDWIYTCGYNFIRASSSSTSPGSPLITRDLFENFGTARSSCATAKAEVDWQRRVLVVACQQVGIIAVPLDVASVSFLPVPSPVLLSVGFGSGCSPLGTPRAALERSTGGSRIYVSCGGGLSFLSGRTLIDVGTMVCDVTNTRPLTLTYDGEGRSYSICESQNSIVTLRGMITSRIQLNQTVCERPVQIGHSGRVGDDLWIVCGNKLHIVTYSPSTSVTTRQAVPDQLILNSAIFDAMWVAVDGRVYVGTAGQVPLVPPCLYRVITSSSRSANRESFHSDSAPPSRRHLLAGPPPTPGLELIYSGSVSQGKFLRANSLGGKIFFVKVGAQQQRALWWRPEDLSANATIAVPMAVCHALDFDVDPSSLDLYVTCNCPNTRCAALPPTDWSQSSLLILSVTDLTSYRTVKLQNPLTSISWSANSGLVYGVAEVAKRSATPSFAVNAIDIARSLFFTITLDPGKIPIYLSTDKSTSLPYIQASFSGLLIPTEEYGCAPGFEFTAGGVCSPCSIGSVQSLIGNPSFSLPRCFACRLGLIAPVVGSTSCEPCQPGEFQQAEERKQFCNVCQVGTVQPEEAAQNCSACEPGKYAPDVRLTACLLCDPGTYSEFDGSASCTPCSRGLYADSPLGATSCSPCSPGRFASDPRQTSCEECEEGSFSTVYGATGCTKCESGQASNVRGRTTECDLCPAGMQQSQTGQTSCDPCDLGSFSSSGGLCTVCPVTYYTPRQGVPCVSCSGPDQEGLDCNNGLASVKPDFWAYLEPSEEFAGEMIYRTTKCPLDHCPGSQLQAIQTNTTGRPASLIAITPACEFPRRNSPDNWLCAECEDGYLPWNGACDACTGVNRSMLAGVILFSFTLVLFLLKATSSSAGQVSILLYFIQISSLEIGSVTRALEWMRFGNLGAQAIGTCLAPLTPLQQTLLTFLTPLWLMGILAFIGCVHVVVHRRWARAERAENLEAVTTTVQRLMQRVADAFNVDRYIGCVMSILLFAYTSVALAVVQSLDCQQVAPGVRLLFASPTVSCNSSEYHTFLPVVISFLSVYILGMPCGMLLFLWARRDAIMLETAAATEAALEGREQQMSTMAMRWGAFYRSYTAHAWYWSPLLLLRRFLFVLTAVLLGSSQARFSVFAILHVTSVVLHLLTRPFDQERMNQVETVSYVVLIYLSIVLTVETSPYSLGIQMLLSILVIPMAAALIGWTAWHQLQKLHAKLKDRSHISSDVHPVETSVVDSSSSSAATFEMQTISTGAGESEMTRL